MSRAANHTTYPLMSPPQAAEERLQRMGPMRASEKIVMCTLSGAVLLWVSREVGEMWVRHAELRAR